MATLTHSHSHPHPMPGHGPGLGPLTPLRSWLDQIQVSNRRFAHLICRVIPCCCPFERDVTLGGHTIHIPALCKLNPLYEEFVGLRFRALAYLTDVCHEDVSRYIC